ncbi:hypothetical protein WJX84_000990 [Apatococcus fuscideae]|uniref:Uncharacterized protein n=1 Tax=Apatococcus fuscideae TaxID=2026836 RepID=A0AAW1T1S1_9CHLO
MLLAGDLKDRAHRLQTRQQGEVERARRKAEKDALLAERAKQRQLAHEDELRKQRLAQQESREAAELRQDEIRERTGGVFWQGNLAAVQMSEDIALQRGIKRSADKVQLPASVGNELMAQDASKNGAIYFELQTSSGAKTHASVLDFSAPEGTVALPQQTARSLFGAHCGAHGMLQITYTTLPKGTFAKFQPATADFQKEVGADMEGVLEAALHARSSLSQGDWVDAQHAGRSFALRVQQLQPEAAVSVIDTEMEADVEPSVETEERLEQGTLETGEGRVTAA